MSTLPSFFKDESESYEVEEVIDYFLSWTIRCADVEYRNQGLVHEYAKKILIKLIFDNDDHENIGQNCLFWQFWVR